MIYLFVLLHALPTRLTEPRFFSLCLLLQLATTQAAGFPPPAQCGCENILVGILNNVYSKHHKVPTTSRIGAPNGVLHRSMSAQGGFYTHTAQGGGGPGHTVEVRRFGHVRSLDRTVGWKGALHGYQSMKSCHNDEQIIGLYLRANLQSTNLRGLHPA